MMSAQQSGGGAAPASVGDGTVLEADYNTLKRFYDELKGCYNQLAQDKQAIQDGYNSLESDLASIKQSYVQLSDSSTSLEKHSSALHQVREGTECLGRTARVMLQYVHACCGGSSVRRCRIEVTIGQHH